MLLLELLDDRDFEIAVVWLFLCVSVEDRAIDLLCSLLFGEFPRGDRWDDNKCGRVCCKDFTLIISRNCCQYSGIIPSTFSNIHVKSLPDQWLACY